MLLTVFKASKYVINIEDGVIVKIRSTNDFNAKLGLICSARFCLNLSTGTCFGNLSYIYNIKIMNKSFMVILVRTE